MFSECSTCQVRTLVEWYRVKKQRIADAEQEACMQQRMHILLAGHCAANEWKKIQKTCETSNESCPVCLADFKPKSQVGFRV
jgi:hypothetical protein